MIWTSALVSMLCYLVQSVLIPDDLLVTIPNGTIQGAAYTTGNNISYFGFRGIPFATPPIDDLRFEPPQPAQSWTGILNATQDASGCISIFYGDSAVDESEDCLYLNVYIPNIELTEDLPVMFFIYGGQFYQGNSSKSFYGPDFLMDRQNVILVTFNYRLGAFGLISTEDEVLPGNAALKDQNLALQWTYENIKYFGGDANKITIFGEDAGGVSTGLHLVSNKSAGLFRAAILQSGSAVNHWSIRQDSKNLTYNLVNGISGGNTENTSQEIKSFLKSRNATEIIASQIANNIVFRPVLEPPNNNSFLSDSPYQLISSGNFSQVPIIIGICAEESLPFLKDLQTAEVLAQNSDLDPTTLIPSDLLPNSTDEDTVVEKIKSIYLTNNQTFSSNLTAFVKYASDIDFVVGVLRHAQLTSNYTSVHLYRFSYYGRPIFSYPLIEGAEKATHTAELAFLFNISTYSNTSDPQDILIQNQITTLWTNFAVYLDPTPDKSNLLTNLTWSALDDENQPFLNINNTLEVGTGLNEETYSKWSSIYETYGRKPFITF